MSGLRAEDGGSGTARIFSKGAARIALPIVAIAVTALSLYPRPESLLHPLTLYDKFEHFLAYMVLALLASRALSRPTSLLVALVVLLCTALGGAIELIQPLVGRQQDLYDFLCNLAGSVTGVAPTLFFLREKRA